jgi:hypothetical protein
VLGLILNVTLRAACRSTNHGSIACMVLRIKKSPPLEPSISSPGIASESILVMESTNERLICVFSPPPFSSET